jgi:hypothetical protein
MNAQYMALAAQYVALADGKFFSGGDRESRDASQEAKVMAMDTCTHGRSQGPACPGSCPGYAGQLPCTIMRQ